MGNTEKNSNIVSLAEHRGLKNTPAEVSKFQKQFAGEILEVVELCNDPRFDWVPFANLVKAILGGRLNPAELANNIEKLRDLNNNQATDDYNNKKSA